MTASAESKNELNEREPIKMPTVFFGMFLLKICVYVFVTKTINFNYDTNDNGDLSEAKCLWKPNRNTLIKLRSKSWRQNTKAAQRTVAPSVCSENGSNFAQTDIHVQLCTYRTNVVKNLKHLFHIRFLCNEVLQQQPEKKLGKFIHFLRDWHNFYLNLQQRKTTMRRVCSNK